MIKIKNISDVITNSSSEVFIRKLKKSERMFLKSLRTKNIEEEKVANPDDPEEWYYIDSCGVEYHKVTKSWLLKEEDWGILLHILGLRPEDPESCCYKHYYNRIQNPNAVTLVPGVNISQEAWDAYYWKNGTYEQFEALVNKYDSVLQEKLYGAYYIEISDHKDSHDQVIKYFGWEGGWEKYPYPLPDGILYFESLH